MEKNSECGDIRKEIKQNWANLLSHGEFLSYQPGQIVYYEKHQSLGAYLLCEGTIELFKADNPSFRRTIVADTKPVLGMDFLLSGTPYEYSAKAVTSARLCYLPKSEILRLIPSVKIDD